MREYIQVNIYYRTIHPGWSFPHVFAMTLFLSPAKPKARAQARF